jgi:hypothetical protein
MNDRERWEMDGWRTLLNIRIEDVRYAKRQQWQVVHYVMLLLAGVLAAYFHMTTNTCCYVSGEVPDIVSAVSITLGIVGTYLIGDFEKNLWRYRKIMYAITTNKDKNCCGKAFGNYVDEKSRKPFRDYPILLAFMGTIWLGASLISFVVKNNMVAGAVVVYGIIYCAFLGFKIKTQKRMLIILLYLVVVLVSLVGIYMYGSNTTWPYFVPALIGVLPMLSTPNDEQDDKASLKCKEVTSKTDEGAPSSGS